MASTSIDQEQGRDMEHQNRRIPGQPVQRITKPVKQRHMGPAVEAAKLVREFLSQHIKASEADLQQMQDGVEVFLHRCMVQFSTPRPQNGSAITDGADYRHPARTAAEIKETIAAEQGAVTKAKQGFALTDTAERIAKREGLADPAAELEPEQPAPAPKPLPPKAKPAEGWIV
jgi:hypothetical protein